MAIIIMAQATSHAPCASNCACAEGLHFSAFHFTCNMIIFVLTLVSGSFDHHLVVQDYPVLHQEVHRVKINVL